MSVAGIKGQDVEIRYLRYCQEYNTAWVEFLPEIAAAIEKFNGKKITKRIDTAVKKVDDRFYITIEKDSYGNSGYIYLKWYDYDGRIFRDEETGQWDYVKSTNGCNFIEMFRVEDMECFDSHEFISRLEKTADRELAYKEESFAALDNLSKLKEEYNQALQTFMEVRNSIPSYILNYYHVDSTYIDRWR